MRNLSKISAALVCAALLFVFAACGNTENDNTTTEPAGETMAVETNKTQETEMDPNEETKNTSDDKKGEKETEKITDKTTEKATDKTTEKTTEKTTQNSNDPHYVENKTEFDTTKHIYVTFVVKDMGEFQVELYPEYAPNTVTNFVNLAYSGYFNGTKFHRVVDDFMVQGGNNTEVEADSIYGEFSSNGYSQNTLKHERGVISMARANDPNSATGQFFICNSDNVSFLDGNYAAFGKVTYGMDVIDSFCEVERGINSLGEIAVPQTDIVIEKAVVSQ